MGPGDPPVSSRERPLGVAEIVRWAHRALDGMGLVWLEGEVAQVNQRGPRLAAGSNGGSAHCYFSLADRGSVLAAVMWDKTVSRLGFAVAAGMRLRVRGRLGVYDRDGKMQLYVDFAEPAGAGDDARALEALKQKLAAEGLFAKDKKRALPRFPRRIGVVTSAKGAAIHDIIRTVQRRYPTPILIADAAVQGPQAPAQLVNGMAMVVRAGVDVLIIGRGGGAATDLTAFNHERVVRTIARCPVPVISAVGHETDLSLADLAADLQCSTPTAAAEHVVPDARVLHEMLDKSQRRLAREIKHVLVVARQDLDRALDRLGALHPRARIRQRQELVGELAARAEAAIGRRVGERRGELGAIAAALHALSPLAVLERGYAIVAKDGVAVRAADEVAAGDAIDVRLGRGTIKAVVA